ncbi:MAG: LOG family protein [Candidatus Omnitrophica bacterium]|nr:LOG family protein [Candidatus Omnitrophota bacterium]
MNQDKIITVFGSGSHLKENAGDYRRAAKLGRVLAENGYVLCNGGHGGVMEASARGAKEAGGVTIGIVNVPYGDKTNVWIDQIKVESTWRDRMFCLIETGDAFVICDGGTGTLAELSVVWEMTNKGMMRKPVIIYGKILTKFVRKLKKERYFSFQHHLKFASTAEEVIEILRDSFEEDCEG